MAQSTVQLSRRAALGVGVIAIAGCHDKPSHPHPSTSATAVLPDAVALATARDAEQKLLASFDAKIKHTPLHRQAPLQVERAIHATHLAALHGSATGTAEHVTPDLPAALRQSGAKLRRLALAATNGANAALLASIAASHTASAQ